MEIVINSKGVARCIYSEDIDLTALGDVAVARASHVEPDERAQWWADLAPVNGPKLGPFARRRQALQAEQEWLELHWLIAQAINSTSKGTT